jgi:flagellar biosynthesis GTPase FlhF
MKIEMIKSSTLINGIKDISDRFGPSALILRNIENEGQEVLFIAHEQSKPDSLKELRLKSSAVKNRESSDSQSKASKNEIELVKQAIKALPDTLNLRNKGLTDNSLTDDGANFKIPKRTSNHGKEVVLESKLNQLLDETPISKHIKKLIPSFLDQPNSKAELLSQIESGIVNNLLDTEEINLDSQIHVLTGGHGSGKTSIALKIAKQFQAAYGNTVSILSFGENLNVDRPSLEMLNSSSTLKGSYARSISELAKLLDLNQNNTYIIDLELDSIPSAVPFIRGIYEKAQFHLVTPTEASIPSLWANCTLDKWDSIILTRLDSPLVPWAAIEALSKFKIPLSIGSNSSDITSGLVKVTKQNISRRITDYINEHVSELDSQTTRRALTRSSALH